ncbi:MAG: mechanosensitive ion channel family protein [Thermodesulfobacteriota bacterium]
MEMFLRNLWGELSGVFQPATLGQYVSLLLTRLIVFLIILAIFWFGWLFVRAGLTVILRRSKTDGMTSTFILTLVKYTLLVIGLTTALDSVGIEVSAVLASLGIAGLTIGFAARDSLSNVIAGILIFLDRPFVIGDLVEIDSNYGRIDRITLRSTRVVTLDGRMLAVPNTEVINKTVASYTNFPHLRLNLSFSIGVSEDIGRARMILLDVVKGRPGFLADPPPRVVLKELGDYSLTIELQAWLDDERTHIEKRHSLREDCFLALRSQGVEMPCETIAVLSAALPP